MLSPKKFAKEINSSYAQVQKMARDGEIEAIFTPKGQIQIPESELAKFKTPKGYVSEEIYKKVVQERDALKTILKGIESLVNSKEE